MSGAIQYAINHEAALRRYCDDGRLEIDNNAAERILRLIAIGRKNWLFYGSERGGRTGAVLHSILASAKRNGLNEFAYLCDVLDRLADLSSEAELHEFSGMTVSPSGFSMMLSTLSVKFGAGYPIKRPKVRRYHRQHLCLDAGYVGEEVAALAHEFHYTLHVRSRGEEAKVLREQSGFRARRWVLERTDSWLNRFRRRLIRWEKRCENYLAMLHLSFALITFGKLFTCF